MMELLYLLLTTIVGVAYAGSGVSYFYPPVYGSFKQTGYSPARHHGKHESHSKAPGYYYPPVYGSMDKKEYAPSRSYQKKEGTSPYEKGLTSFARKHKRVHPYEQRRTPYHKHKSTRTKYEQPKREETIQYRMPEKRSYSKKTQKCFQCEYSPPKPIEYEVLVTEPYDIKVPKQIEKCEWDRTIEYVYVEPKRGSDQMYGRYKEVPKYEKTCYPKTVYETKTKYRRRYVKKEKIGDSGGFEACRGPLNSYSAKKHGVDDWDCHNNCFVRKDKSGTISRGCYSGQYKVDPDLLGCHYQGDNKKDLYCFCSGDHCNGKEIPHSHQPEKHYEEDYDYDY